MNVSELRPSLEEHTDTSTDLTILSWVLMTGYCICGIFRKSLHPMFALNLLTQTRLVSLYGGGRHMWEVTSDEVTQFLKVRDVHTLSVTATDNKWTGRICRNAVLRSNDPLHQAQPPLPDRTSLRSIQTEGPRHLRPRSHLDYLLHHIVDPEDPHLRPNLRLLAPGNGQMSRSVSHHPRRLDRQHYHRRNHPGPAFAPNVVSPNPQREETAGRRYAGRRRPRYSV
jgi:hypothetical protein